MNRWQNKVAIVTGASVGIGAAISQKLVEEGLQVVGFTKNVDRIQEISRKLQNKKGKLHAISVDLTKEEEILQAFKWVYENLGPVHILVNNAGIIQDTNLTDGETEKWKKIFEVNVLGLCIATREAVKTMRENKIDGHIVHVNGICGHKVPTFPNLNVYPASKFAVTALTETLRQELNSLGLKIKISSVSPGAVLTKIAHANDGKRINSDMAEMLKTAPMLTSKDVADAILFILSAPPHVQVHELIIKPVGESF